MFDKENIRELLLSFSQDASLLPEISRQATEELLPYCATLDEAYDGFFVITSIVLTFVATDELLSPAERKLLRELLDIDDALIDSYADMYTPVMKDFTKSLLKNAPKSIQDNIFTLMLAFFSCDREITDQELDGFFSLFQ